MALKSTGAALTLVAGLMCQGQVAAATAQVTLTNRYTHNYIEWFAGFAIEDARGNEGSSQVIDSLHPAGIYVPAEREPRVPWENNAGSAAGDFQWLNQTADYSISWDQEQVYDRTASSLIAEGYSTLFTGGTATVGIEGWNQQTFQFTVSGGHAPFVLTGLLSGGQALYIETYNAGQDTWQWFRPPFVSSASTPAAVMYSDTLAPGFYRFHNHPFPFTANNSRTITAQWQWTLGFPADVLFDSAAIGPPIPEPQTYALMLAGPAMLARAARFRTAARNVSAES